MGLPSRLWLSGSLPVYFTKARISRRLNRRTGCEGYPKVVAVFWSTFSAAPWQEVPYRTCDYDGCVALRTA